MNLRTRSRPPRAHPLGACHPLAERRRQGHVATGSFKPLGFCSSFPRRRGSSAFAFAASCCPRRRFTGNVCFEHGQGIVEFIIAIGAFGAFLLGIFQVALLYRAKTTVDYAAFLAAREGSLNGATQQSIEAGMLKGLTPLYATDASGAGLLEARGKAELAGGVYRQARAEIVSPTKATFNRLAVPQFDGVRAIPNDSLAYRSEDVRAANVLKVKVTYAYPLIVPVVDKVIGVLFGGKQLVMDGGGTPRMMYALPIEAQAVVNMQNPIRDTYALGQGNGGDPGDGGGGIGPPGDGGPGDGGGTGDPPGNGDEPPGNNSGGHPICTGE